MRFLIHVPINKKNGESFKLLIKDRKKDQLIVKMLPELAGEKDSTTP